jgi:hypothetical protein
MVPMVPQMPALQPIPQAINVQSPIPSMPTATAEDSSDPFGQALQMMQMRNMYSQ